MKQPEPFAHGEIKKIFDTIFMVTGANITEFQGVTLQHSRNMVIVKNNHQLHLINTVRLSDDALAQLDSMGDVASIIRIGAFHGRDDAFYVNRYPQSTYWDLQAKSDIAGTSKHKPLIEGGEMPIANAALINFDTSQYPEAIIHLDQEGGILITCDSIKNWVQADEFFSPETAAMYEQQGFFGKATITDVWLNACKVKQSDFAKLKQFSFTHLLSAHGEPLLGNADKTVFANLS